MFAAVGWATWDQAAVAAACSTGAWLGLRGRTRTVLRTAGTAAAEFAFVAGLYAIWRLARMLPIAQEEGAIDRAWQIARLQEWLHLPSELSLQHWTMQHATLTEWTVWYYGVVHVPALIIFLIWLWLRQRDHYKRWRTGLVLTTAGCLIIRFARVAPPRFLPELGFVDLSNRVGFSVYGSVGTGVSDQFAAMPSIHVAWAAVVALGAVAASPSRWRWLIFLHLPITMFVVAATGHHWWMDGFVALALLGGALALDRRLRSEAIG